MEKIFLLIIISQKILSHEEPWDQEIIPIEPLAPIDIKQFQTHLYKNLKNTFTDPEIIEENDIIKKGIINYNNYIFKEKIQKKQNEDAQYHSGNIFYRRFINKNKDNKKIEEKNICEIDFDNLNKDSDGFGGHNLITYGGAYYFRDEIKQKFCNKNAKTKDNAIDFVNLFKKDYDDKNERNYKMIGNEFDIQNQYQNEGVKKETNFYDNWAGVRAYNYCKKKFEDNNYGKKENEVFNRQLYNLNNFNNYKCGEYKKNSGFDIRVNVTSDSKGKKKDEIKIEGDGIIIEKDKIEDEDQKKWSKKFKIFKDYLKNYNKKKRNYAFKEKYIEVNKGCNKISTRDGEFKENCNKDS